MEEFHAVRPLHWTTHSLTLTEEGHTLLSHANMVLKAVDNTRDALRPRVLRLQERFNVGQTG